MKILERQGFDDIDAREAALKEGKLDILEARRPLSDAHRAIIAIQDERFATPAPVAHGPATPAEGFRHRQAWTSFLAPATVRGMETEWRAVLCAARKHGRVVCRHRFVAADFVLAQHMLQHVRHEWGLPAAMVYGAARVRRGETHPDDIWEQVYMVPFYRVLQPRRRVRLPTLSPADRVFSDYNR